MGRHLLMVACTVPLLSSAAPVKNGFVTTSDGVKLHYLEAGSGPAILFVPGWTMPAEIWEAQIRHFSQRYRVVALDPRSQGESAQAAEGHYPERRARDIKEVVDQLGLSPVVLVGWSMGVSEALTYVDQFGTATLRALALVDGNIGEDATPLSAAGNWARVRGMQLNRREFTQKFVRSMYKKPQAEAYYNRITAAALKTPTTTAVTLLANEFARGDWRPVLGKLDRPVLYAITPDLKAQAEALKARVPAARVEIFGDCGHALFVDDAARFNAVLEEFLRAGSSGE
jgi:non-heme chloroperoxidase